VKIGVFGGSFDPIHVGHLVIAQEARWQCGLDRVLFVINAHPPHKQEPEASAQDRLAMVELAIDGEEGLETSRIEIERGGHSYTLETLQELHRLYPDAAFYLIIGADSLLDFSMWKNPEAVLKMTHMLVAPRPGFDLSNVESTLRDKTHTFQAPTIELSSTMIRERLHEGKPIRFLVPKVVERYIREQHLYSY
jgi:nicotinate-nucleotide adenylyltransferase